MTYRRSILSAAIVTCLGVAVQAHAQDAQPTGTQATDLDTVVACRQLKIGPASSAWQQLAQALLGKARASTAAGTEGRG